MVGDSRCVICGAKLPMDMTQLILNMGDGHFESCCCSHEGSQALNDYHKAYSNKKCNNKEGEIIE